MIKIIDSFLFFQELDLLEIRLAFLDSYVDTFVIVEACQTFTGKAKGFVFEENKERFEKYLPKIEYYKITDFHENYNSIINFLKKGGDSQKKIISILEGHDHYSKEHLHWVLDTYHRECLHIVLDKVARNEDIVMISDLDEIPSKLTFEKEQKERELLTPIVYEQKEFRYFLNYYKDSEWLGTISSKYSLIRNYSFNELRIDSKKKRVLVDKYSLENAGYHFTTCGGVEMIKEKIKSWGHQEFNNKLVMENLEKNIKQGKDVFMRESGTNLKLISTSDIDYFEPEISKIINKFPHLLADGIVKSKEESNSEKFFQKVLITLYKIKYKISLIISK